MRLELLGASGADLPEADLKRDIGAIVARSTPAGGVQVELGPADGPAHLRLTLSAAEALRLAATLRAIADGRDQEIVLTEP